MRGRVLPLHAMAVADDEAKEKLKFGFPPSQNTWKGLSLSGRNEVLMPERGEILNETVRGQDKEEWERPKDSSDEEAKKLGAKLNKVLYLNECLCSCARTCGTRA